MAESEQAEQEQQGEQDAVEKLRNVVEEAIERQERQVEEHVEAFGAEHEATLSMRGELAYSYWQTGRHEEAIEIEEDVAEISERTLGADSPATLRARVNLAATYWSDGRHERGDRHRGGGARGDRAGPRRRPSGHAHGPLEPLVLLRLGRPRRRGDRGAPAGARGSRARARRRRGCDPRGASEPRAAALVSRSPRRGDRRRGGGRSRDDAHPWARRHRDAHRAARSRVLLPPGRPHRQGAHAPERCSSPTWSACSASTTPRRTRRRRPSSRSDARVAAGPAERLQVAGDRDDADELAVLVDDRHAAPVGQQGEVAPGRGGRVEADRRPAAIRDVRREAVGLGAFEVGRASATRRSARRRRRTPGAGSALAAKYARTSAIVDVASSALSFAWTTSRTVSWSASSILILDMWTILTPPSSGDNTVVSVEPFLALAALPEPPIDELALVARGRVPRGRRDSGSDAARRAGGGGRGRATLALRSARRGRRPARGARRAATASAATSGATTTRRTRCSTSSSSAGAACRSSCPCCTSRPRGVPGSRCAASGCPATTSSAIYAATRRCSSTRSPAGEPVTAQSRRDVRAWGSHETALRILNNLVASFGRRADLMRIDPSGRAAARAAARAFEDRPAAHRARRAARPPKLTRPAPRVRGRP